MSKQVAKHAFVYKEKDYVYRVAVESEGTLYIMKAFVHGGLAVDIANSINETKLFDPVSFSTIAELFSK